MVDSILNKIFTLSSLSFIAAFLVTPLLTAFLYRNKLGKQIRNDGSTPLFSKLHASKAGTPTMGGVLVWGTTCALAGLLWLLKTFTDWSWAAHLNFLTRKETLLPLGAFLGASLVGLVDDWLDARRLGHNGRGLRFRSKLWLYVLVAAIGAWWFYFKLDFSSIHVPFYGSIDLGWWYIPFFIFTVVATSFSVNQTDGLDGLAGGILSLAFFGFALIAYIQGKNDLASLLGVVCGSLLAFLWFNVYPARFFMGDTGSMGLGVLLAVVAFLTNSVLLIPIIGVIFLLEALSTIIQIFSKKFLGRKVFLSSPLHNHFQAIGWPETKITMRFWIISAVMSIVGVIIYFIT
ncbi:MAG: phospho-N-acetylmuramoyl-pentapeptide-transferase [Patescibacteria group bacterium]|nr:phospho-N-acetylmuramoyl-pentapeptide-transferase [Patescibacteria group bacterium]